MRVAVLGDMDSVHTPRWCEALIARGLDVRCFSLEPFTIGAPYATFVEPRLGPQKLRYVSSFDRVGRAVKAFDPDVVNPVHFPNYGLVNWLMGHRLPVYLVGWGSDILHSAEKTPLHKMIMRRIIARAERINVDAEIMRTYLIDRYGYRGEDVDFITWGLPESWYADPLPDPIPEGPPWKILCHRRLDYDMDPLMLLKSFKLARERGLDAILSVKGHGAWEDKVKAWVTELGLDAHVEYIPWFDYEDLRPYIAKHHMYTSSAWVDSTSVSILEVMNQGVLPIVTDIPANREWVIHGHNGYLFHPKSMNAMAQCLIDAAANVELRQRARAINRKIVEDKARWEVHMDTSADAMRELVRAAKEGRAVTRPARASS